MAFSRSNSQGFLSPPRLDTLHRGLLSMTPPTHTRQIRPRMVIPSNYVINLRRSAKTPILQLELTNPIVIPQHLLPDILPVIWKTLPPPGCLPPHNYNSSNSAKSSGLILKSEGSVAGAQTGHTPTSTASGSIKYAPLSSRYSPVNLLTIG